MDEKPRPAPDQGIGRRTRRSFLVGGAASAAAFGIWEFIRHAHREGSVPWPLRQGLEFNEELSRGYFRATRFAPEFPVSSASIPKVNGDIGMDDDDFDPAKWSLQVDGLSTEDGTATLSIGDIRALPHVEMVTELKCVEGWSKKVHWGGARFADFARKYPPATSPRDSYVAMQTPGNDYYVGIDLPSAMHPQTLLCYEMDGRPLEDAHGAPLRLVIPARYGIKNLKRIGRIAYTASRPPDYWAERGYDYYAAF